MRVPEIDGDTAQQLAGFADFFQPMPDSKLLPVLMERHARCITESAAEMIHRGIRVLGDLRQAHRLVESRTQ
jgi:hypothetical protein